MKYKGTLFKSRKINFNKLQKFGFTLYKGVYVYKTNIFKNTFELTIKIKQDETIDTELIEIETNEQYNLVHVNCAEGEFIGQIKKEYENILLKIENECSDFNVFKTEYANKIIDYIEKKYGDKAEYLWEKFPNNAIFRKNNNPKTKGKWYAAILTAKKESMGLKGKGEIEIIDLKNKPEIIDKIVDNKKYFHGYHMNKKHWYTIFLDGSVSIDEIKRRIDESYNIVS